MGADRQRGILRRTDAGYDRTGGKRYTPGETERIIHDGFIVQVPMAFEDYTYLSIDKGQHGSYLPIQMEPDTVLYFYPQWK